MKNINITDFIPKGRANAISSKELKALIGIDERTVRQNIASTRLKGVVICSILDGNSGGYFLPESPEEAVEYVRTERARIRSAKRALQGAEKYISELEAHSND